MICQTLSGIPITFKLFKMNKNKKVMRFENKRVQNEKKHILQFVKTYFPYNFFWAGPLALHFKELEKMFL
jgi:hypothetical protein